MQRSNPLVAILLVCLLLATAVGIAAGAIQSGPQPGELLPGPFHPYNATGEHAGRLHCLVCELGLNPVAAIFMRELPEANEPLATLLKKLDEAVVKRPGSKTGAFAVLLSDSFTDLDKRQALGQKLADLAKQLDLKQLVLALDTATGPADYKLDKDTEVTVLLYQRHKVVANYAYARGTLAEKDVEEIMAGVDKLIGVSKK